MRVEPLTIDDVMALPQSGDPVTSAEAADQEGRSEAGGRCSRYRLTAVGLDEAKEARDVDAEGRA
ncbi:hypothetical protein BACT_0517 [Bifidobacterium actinocoloniiforme DSM 22766]|uniref:Uncharacterized protein n=1 Tax=Bifidobacterium actinocoloniiforme DSM 22766 TaxID=1437605 RepID=A0A086YZW6_9BIFI|nr:hypothetical protein BACT_0517 [Bifidobacterium actinocoloniiforme DSM 22766]